MTRDPDDTDTERTAAIRELRSGVRPGNALEGRGLFAAAPIGAGELIVTWGGRLVARGPFGELPRSVRALSLQVEDDLFLVPRDPGPADCVNHCCEPNTGMRGDRSLVALRDIAPGEELTYDYAMSDGSAYDEFTCLCGADRCRGRITGEDWRLPELWERYGEHFSPYLLRRIARLRAGLSAYGPSDDHGLSDGCQG